MAEEIKVPDIGDFDEVEVIEVLVAVGDTVSQEDPLISLESDKATMEVPAPRAGKVTEIKVDVGDKVSEGSVVLLMDVEADAESEAGGEEDKESADKSSAKSEPEETATESQGESESRTESSAGDAKGDDAGDQTDHKPARREPPVSFDASRVLPEKTPHASPSVRKLARQLGVDLNEVTGTGRKGRILDDDVRGFVKNVMQARSQGGGTAGGRGLSLLDWPKVDFSKFGETSTESLSRIQKISGANLSRNWAMIPHVTQHDEADITEMEAFRKGHAEEAKAKGFKLTPLAFLMKACVAALKEFPTFNASLDASGENLVLKKYFHIGVAVDTPDGLVVPVIRDCDKKSLYELADEVVQASVKARDKKLSPADMQGGCFSISSLGGIGGTAFTPIINAPEVAILGVSRSSQQPVWNGNEFEPRLMLPLSLSYDHRVIDGATAARFTSYLAYVLGDLRRLLL